MQTQHDVQGGNYFILSNCRTRITINIANNYLGTIVNGNFTLEEDIRERIVKGNKAFYANRALFKSKLVSIKSKLKLYWSVIRPVVVYGCETWVLKVLYRDSQCLRGKFLDQLK
jgi:hypothetical protein